MSIRSAVFAIALAVTTCAQAADSLLQALTPNPLGMIITVGRWLMNSSERVYEVEVEGRGDTLDLARDNGHRLAVQQAVGSLNLRQTQRDGDRITQDRQIIYSSGFIQDWRETRSYRNSAGQWCLVMTVRVRHSSIADGLVGQPARDSGTFDGRQLGQLLASQDKERRDSVSLLQAVLEKWPASVMQIRHQPLATQVSNDGAVSVKIPTVEITVDESWQQSLYETLDLIGIKRYTDAFAGWSSWGWGRKHWYLRYKEQHDLMLSTFDKEIYLRVRLMADSRVLRESCLSRVSLFNSGERAHGLLFVMPDRRLVLENLSFSVNRSYLAQINSVVFDLVPQNLCR